MFRTADHACASCLAQRTTCTTMSTSTATVSPQPIRRSSSRSGRSFATTNSRSSQKRSPSPPTQVFHRSILSHPSPTSQFFGHYSGAETRHRRSDKLRASFGAYGATVEVDENRAQLMHDLQEVSITSTRRADISVTAENSTDTHSVHDTNSTAITLAVFMSSDRRHLCTLLEERCDL